MEIVIDISSTTKGLNTLIKSLSDGNSPIADRIQRTIIQGLYVQMTERIYNENGGKKSDGSLIGVYSPAYLKRRKVKQGRNNRNVNLIYTSQEFSAFTTVTSNGQYAIGFGNDLAAKKSRWNEDMFGSIFALTTKEKESITDLIKDALGTFK